MSKIEKITAFPPHVSGETPLLLWEKLHPSIAAPRHETYVSMPITSGPAKNYLLAKQEKLSQSEIVALTIKTNMRFADTLVPNLQTESNVAYTFPHHLDSRHDWKETDYNAFWMKYISGITPQKAREFNEHSEKTKVVNKDVFNDHFATREARLSEYEKLFDSFKTFTKNETLNPISKMVFMPGHDESFGCTLERMLAESLKISREFVVFDRNHTEFGEKIQTNAPWITDKHVREHTGASLLLFEKPQQP